MRILKITALSFIVIGSLILTPTTANSAPKKSSNKQITISVEIEGLTNFADYDMYSQVQYVAVASIFENNCVVSK